MKNVQHGRSPQQSLDIRAARTLCREGWACEHINSVLKNIDITQQQHVTIRERAREFNELEQYFSSPNNSLNNSPNNIEQLPADNPHSSALDFLNRGPDAAYEILRDYGWEQQQIRLVLEESMFDSFDAPRFTAMHLSRGSSQSHQPNSGYPGPSSSLSFPGQRRPLPRRIARGSLGRDVSILAFMATFAFVLLFTFL